MNEDVRSRYVTSSFLLGPSADLRKNFIEPEESGISATKKETAAHAVRATAEREASHNKRLSFANHAVSPAQNGAGGQHSTIQETSAMPLPDSKGLDTNPTDFSSMNMNMNMGMGFGNNLDYSQMMQFMAATGMNGFNSVMGKHCTKQQPNFEHSLMNLKGCLIWR